jgi:hypothetical protein
MESRKKKLKERLNAYKALHNLATHVHTIKGKSQKGGTLSNQPKNAHVESDVEISLAVRMMKQYIQGSKDPQHASGSKKRLRRCVRLCARRCLASILWVTPGYAKLLSLIRLAARYTRQ